MTGTEPAAAEREWLVDLPAWSARVSQLEALAADAWPEHVTREWAWGGSTGAGVRVCVIDSGIERGHPAVGEIDGAVVVLRDDDGTTRTEPDEEGDVAGHGTACAGIIRALAPECSLHSVRVLGGGMTGRGLVLVDGLRWALEQDFDVISMSLSTTKPEFASMLSGLVDDAYFHRVVLVASAHNRPVESYPWHFSSVVSVGSHDQDDPLAFFYNPSPPVEFFARGVDVDVAWSGGATLRVTGNSFAAPHVAGICALVLGKHPELTPFQLKSVLHETATNSEGAA